MPAVLNPSLDSLRAQVRAIESAGAAARHKVLPFGIPDMDDRLAGGGLARDALHEVAAASAALSDDAAATLFAAGIAARLKGAVLWVLGRHDLFAPALAQAGLPPDRLIYAECRKDEDALAVTEEGVRHKGIGVVVAEVGRVAMTATRRLQLAAEDSGTTALLIRRWRSAADPLIGPSAAATRWRIACVPSEPLAVAGIGRPRWAIELVRQRGGPTYDWIMEGSDEAGRLAPPAGAQHRTAAPARALNAA
ncbi:MAG TPA: protein ImuA [Sphingomicrobium sp.]|jgi:protein ImuA